MSNTPNGEWMILSAAPPGQEEESIAVLLLDRDSGAPYRRFRRDLAEFAPDEADILEALEEDFVLKIAEMGLAAWMDWLDDHASHFIRVTERDEGAVGDFRAQLDWLYHRHVKPRVLPFRTHLPRYSLVAAAGRWGPERDVSNEPQDWVEVPTSLRHRLTDQMFVVQVTGHSMEPHIPADSWCIFRGGFARGGSRQGRRVLVLNYRDSGDQRATVKTYESVRRQVTEDSFRHERIILHPLNPAYDTWELTDDQLEEGGPYCILGEFVAVLDDRAL